MRYFMMVPASAFLALISLVVLGCADQQPSPPSKQPTAAGQAVEAENPPQETAIPADVEYSVLDSSTLPGIKRNLDVRLNRKVSQETLRLVALELKAKDPRDYERTFIGYYLPGMAVGAGAWATTHFDPDLEVRILGLTAEEEEKLVAEVTSPGREVIGRWLDESPFVGSRITIFREEGTLFMEQLFKDGSALKREMIERSSASGRGFEKAEESSAGDHWLLRSNGDLESRDNDGLISTSKKIK